VQVQADIGVLVSELLDHLGQHVTGLRVGGSDRERAARFVLELLGQVLDVADLAQDAGRAVDHLLPGRRDPCEIAPVAHEDLEPELVLEQLDLLADARLRGVELLRRGGDVETGLGDGLRDSGVDAVSSAHSSHWRDAAGLRSARRTPDRPLNAIGGRRPAWDQAACGTASDVRQAGSALRSAYQRLISG
jgi:hypothetical protein